MRKGPTNDREVPDPKHVYLEMHSLQDERSVSTLRRRMRSEQASARKEILRQYAASVDLCDLQK
jgi:hypothetical protein